MKKTHLIILIVTTILALSSAYSLAAINQVYKVRYEWYSEFNEKFVNESRITYMDKWLLQDYPSEMQLLVIGNSSSAEKARTQGQWGCDMADTDFSKYILLYCTFGKVYSPEYRIKVADIAQRGSDVEIKVSTNSPEKLVERNSIYEMEYMPVEIVRIKKSSLTTKGRLNFVFKNQDGRKLYEAIYDVW